MRWKYVLILSLAFGQALAQVTPEEQKALSDTLFLNNLTLKDLNFNRQTIAEAEPLELVHQCVDKPLDGANRIMQLHQKIAKALPSDLIHIARTELLGDPDQLRQPTAPIDLTIPTDVPVEIRPVVVEFAKAVERANSDVYVALKGLTPQEKRVLIDSLPKRAVQAPEIKFAFMKTRPSDYGSIRDL